MSVYLQAKWSYKYNMKTIYSSKSKEERLQRNKAEKKHKMRLAHYYQNLDPPADTAFPVASS